MLQSNTSMHRFSLFSHKEGMKTVAALRDAALECCLKGKRGSLSREWRNNKGNVTEREQRQVEELSHSSAKMEVSLRRGL